VTSTAEIRPTADQLQQERSLFITNLADVITISTLVVVALMTGSLTILSEAVRGTLMISIQFYSIWVLWAMHRGKLRHFEYGPGKIEELVWVIVGAALIVAAVWIAWRIIDAVFSAEPAASPTGLAVAAVVNAANCLVNGLGFHSMYAAAKGKESGVFGAQLRARVTMLTASAILQVTLTIAAFAKDAEIALLLDALGATLIVGLKFQTGLRMIGRALPALIDAPAKGEVALQIRSRVHEALPEARITSIRTRQVDSTIFAQVELAPEDLQMLHGFSENIAAIRRDMYEDGYDLDLSFAVAPPESFDDAVRATAALSQHGETVSVGGVK
jgi:divalent metal cation (Fe/Co/Zn/Cd) transporter